MNAHQPGASFGSPSLASFQFMSPARTRLTSGRASKILRVCILLTLLTEDSILSPCMHVFSTVQALYEAALCLSPATILISGTTKRMRFQPGPHRLRLMNHEGHACTCASCSLRGSVAGAPRVGLSRWTVAQRREVPPIEMLIVRTDLPAHTAIPRTLLQHLT